MSCDFDLRQFTRDARVGITGIPREDVLCSYGVRQLIGDDALANCYVEGSWVPSGRWNPVSRELYAALTDMGFEGRRSVARFSISDPDLARLKQHAELCECDSGILSAGDPLHLEVLQTLEPYAHTTVASRVHVPQTAPPGAWTLTRDNHNARLRIGLHIDSWEHHEAAERDRAMNRLCINLGPGQRYFLFAPITVSGMNSWLESRDEPYANVNEIRDRFFRAFPELPMLAIRLLPGDVYAAPTENTVHDGSTWDSSTEATHIPVRGQWVPQSTPQATVAPAC